MLTVLSLLVICHICLNVEFVESHSVPNPRMAETQADVDQFATITSHRPMNGVKIGRPVKYVTDYGTAGTQFLTQYSYSSSDCSGTASEISSVNTGVCYEVDYRYQEVYDDEMHYYFYFQANQGKQERAVSSGAGSKEQQASTTTKAPQYWHYNYYYSVLYSVYTVEENGVTSYLLNTTWFEDDSCEGSTTTSVTTVSSECASLSSEYYGEPFGYAPHMTSGSQYYELSSSQFSVPTTSGVLASYYASYDACNYYSQDVTAPYVVWEAMGQCLAYNTYDTMALSSCTSSQVEFSFYYNTDCNRYSYYYDYYQSYTPNVCNNYYVYNGFEYDFMLQCTGSGFFSPTKAPVTKPTANPTTRPGAPSPRPSARPSARPTHKPTKNPTVIGIFYVTQTLTNMVTTDMNSYQAMQAFKGAVVMALDSSAVVQVVISTVTTLATPTPSPTAFAFLHTTATDDGDAINVAYSVQFSALQSQVDTIYYELSTGLAYAVAYGEFQLDLNVSAAEQSPIPLALQNCGATDQPSISTYSIISSNDDADDDDDYWSFDDDKLHFDDADDNENKNSHKALSSGAVIAISIVVLLVIAAVIGAATMYYRGARKRKGGYASGEQTSVASMEVMNPTFTAASTEAEHGKGGTAVELSSTGLPSAPPPMMTYGGTAGVAPPRAPYPQSYLAGPGYGNAPAGAGAGGNLPPLVSPFTVTGKGSLPSPPPVTNTKRSGTSVPHVKETGTTPVAVDGGRDNLEDDGGAGVI